MSDEARSPGWYPDKETRGTKYWDGHRWTGDKRPQRKAFAAVSSHRGWGIGLIIFGVLEVFASPTRLTATQTSSSVPPVANFFLVILVGFVIICWGIYLLRGQGPSTKSVVARLQQENPQYMQQAQQPQYNQQAQDPQVMQHSQQITVTLGQPAATAAAPQQVMPQQVTPQPVAKDCTACGAPLSGLQGQVITCAYCNSAQQL